MNSSLGPRTRLKSFIPRALFAAALSYSVVLFAETPPWERLIEPAAPDTEAIKKAAEEASKRQSAAGEPVPQPAALSKKEREKMDKEKREAEKKELKRGEKEKKEAEKKEKERLKREEKERQKREKEKKAEETAASAPAPKPVEPAEPAKAEAPAPKPIDPAKPARAEAPAPKPVDPAKPAKPAEQADGGDDGDVPAKSEASPKPTEAPKPAEPVKPETPHKQPEPAKVGAADKPVESTKAEVLPKPVKSVEPATPAPTAAESNAGREGHRHRSGRNRRGGGPAVGSRIGLRASIGIGGLGGHNPAYLGPDTLMVVVPAGGKINSGDVYVKDDEDGDPIYRRIDYDREIALQSSLSGGVSVALLSRINALLGISCEVQYSFYVASGEYVANKDKFGETSKDAVAWPVSEATVELHTLEIPVLLRIDASAPLGYPVYAEVGPQFGFNVYARKTAYDGGANGKSAVLIWRPNGNIFAFGPVVGAGLDLGRISIGLRAHVGLMKYQEFEGGKPWSVTLGATSFF